MVGWVASNGNFNKIRLDCASDVYNLGKKFYIEEKVTNITLCSMK